MMLVKKKQSSSVGILVHDGVPRVAMVDQSACLLENNLQNMALIEACQNRHIESLCHDASIARCQ